MAADGAQAAEALRRSPVVWSERYRAVRAWTLALSGPLTAEDQQIQSMPDVSPTKWHLAHTTWFFETFLLKPGLPGYEVFDRDYGYLFNSYYDAVGERHPRPERGLLSRPSLEDVQAYRRHVDAAMARLLRQPSAETAALLELGLNHEQQHQELLLMDIKHVLSVNPLAPAYLPAPAELWAAPPELGQADWLSFGGGLVEIGAQDEGGFCFDNETPRHRVWLEPFKLKDRLVTCGEWQAFIAAGGYQRPELWLSDGWACVQAGGWSAPLYWRRASDGWRVFTLHGERPLEAAEPVCHVSYYEADAYARWSGHRLPTEAEWETAARSIGSAPEGERLHPAPAGRSRGLRQMTDVLWQWTASPYTPYPRYRPVAGALGEYNGKFMCNQMVLRGGACITPRSHSRPTYRNFFPPAARWCFGGLRLADDA